MSDSISIVQVHLGKIMPRHLYVQLKQTRIFNPAVPIYLVVSEDVEYDRRLIDEAGVIMVRKERIAPCRNHRAFLRRNRLNRRSLGGFWLFTSERFFAIESFMSACDVRNVVHLENDVMLYMDLDRYADTLQEKCPRIGVTMDADTRCVPGFVFIRDREALSGMNGYIVSDTLKKAKNDMRALALFMIARGGDECSALPVIPPRYRELYPLVNIEGERGGKPWFDESFSAFGGVFDAAALGQYLGGIDPKISEGDTRGFVSETAVYDPRNMGLHWKAEDGLRRPFGSVGDIEFPVFNLHIHSKRLEEFSSDAPNGEPCE